MLALGLVQDLPVREVKVPAGRMELSVFVFEAAFEVPRDEALVVARYFLQRLVSQLTLSALLVAPVFLHSAMRRLDVRGMENKGRKRRRGEWKRPLHMAETREK